MFQPQPGDKKLMCHDCHKEFYFTVKEQGFFKDRGFKDPRRCFRCRTKIRLQRNGSGFDLGSVAEVKTA